MHGDEDIIFLDDEEEDEGYLFAGQGTHYLPYLKTYINF